MNREEAIFTIENRDGIMDYGETEQLGEALDLAIEALKAEPCDAVSREAVLEVVNNPLNIKLDKIIEKLPPVTPKQRTGHWVEIGDEPYDTWECDNCGFVIDGSGCVDPEEYRDIYKYCPHCGAKMEGESE